MAKGYAGFEKGKLYQVSLSELTPDPRQPRKYFDPQALRDLKLSIEKHGVLQPVLVRKGESGSLFLVSGERRYQACLLAGLPTIPALVTDGDPAEISIVENLLRENLTAIEEAEAIDRLKADHRYHLSDLSSVLGKAESTISEILSLTKLPATVKDDCRNDPRTSRRVLVEIAKLRDPEKMIALYARYKASGRTRGEVRNRAYPAAKAAEGRLSKELAYLRKCVARISSLNLSRLDPGQLDAAGKDLALLRSAALKQLKVIQKGS